MARSDSAHVVTLTLPADPENLAICRLALVGFARAAGPVDAETLADLKLAVTEACASAMREVGAEQRDVAVRFRLGAGAIEVEVAHEVGSAPPPALEPGVPGDSDLGLAILRAVTDELELRSGPGGRGGVVRFSKRLR